MKKMTALLLAAAMAMSSVTVSFATKITEDFGTMILSYSGTGYEGEAERAEFTLEKDADNEYTVRLSIDRLSSFELVDKDKEGNEVEGAGEEGYWIPLIIHAPAEYEYYRYNNSDYLGEAEIKPLKGEMQDGNKGILIWAEAGTERGLDEFAFQWLKDVSPEEDGSDASPVYKFKIDYSDVSIVHEVSSEAELQQAMTVARAGDKVLLGADFAVTSSIVFEQPGMEMDLGGHTLTMQNNADLSVDAADTTIRNGEIVQDEAQTTSIFSVKAGAGLYISKTMSLQTSNKLIDDEEGSNTAISPAAIFNKMRVKDMPLNRLGNNVQVMEKEPDVPQPTPDRDDDADDGKDYFGTEKWDEVKDQIAEAEEGDTIRMSATALPHFPSSVARALRGRDITLEIRKNGETYRLNGLEIGAVDKIWYEFDELEEELLTVTASTDADGNKTNPDSSAEPAEQAGDGKQNPSTGR